MSMLATDLPSMRDCDAPGGPLVHFVWLIIKHRQSSELDRPCRIRDLRLNKAAKLVSVHKSNS